MRSVEDRYMNDPMFHRLVDMLESLLVQAQTTPTEIREACMLAQMHYEEKHVRKTWIQYPDGRIEPVVS